MKRSVSIICAIIVAAMCSACASFKSVEQADAFLAAEKAKGIMPKTTKKVVSVLPQDDAGNKVLGTIGGIDILYLPTLSLIGTKVAANIVTGIKRGTTPQENLWLQASAITEYGRFVEYKRVVNSDRNIFTIFDLATKRVGPPPAPCQLAAKYFQARHNEGASRFKQTHMWCTDKDKGIFVVMSNRLTYALYYKTVLPENLPDGETYALCTPEMVNEHFTKIVKIMEDR